MKKILGISLASTGLFVTSLASAEPAFTANTLQLGGGLSYGIFTGDDEGDPPNPYNLGVGLRGGTTLDMGLYVGGVFDYYFGESVEQTLPFVGTIEASTNIYQVGAEVGYDVGVGPSFVLRPKVGVNYATAAVEISAGGMSSDDSESGIAFAPGAQALLNMDGWFLSFDARYNIFSIESEDTDPITGTTTTTDTDLSGFLLGAGAGATF